MLSRDEASNNATFSLTMSLALKLKTGDLVSLKTKGSSKYSLDVQSGFFAILLNEGGNIPGFSTVFVSPFSGNGRTWISISIPNPTTEYGQFDANPGSISSGRFYSTSRSVFTISALLHIKATSSSSLIITLKNDPADLAVIKTGLFTTQTHNSENASYCVTGLLEALENQPLSLYIYLATQEEYMILNGSRISIAATQQEYQALHVVVPATKSYSKSNTWVRLDTWKVLDQPPLQNTGSYSFTKQFANGKYTAGITGIYHVAANVILPDVNGPISVIISVQGDTSKRRSLHATKGNPSTLQDSISVTGALYVQAGASVAVYVMVENDVSWSVGEKSTFSVVFIGQHFAVPGISTVLKNRLQIATTGWLKVSDWQEQTMATSMFDSGGTFDAVKGDYVVPETGLYLVSASLKLQDASLKLSSFTLNIAIDGDPSGFANQNAIQDYIENNFDPPLANDFYSLVAGGVISVAKGQVVNIYVKSDVDDSYSISQDSSFSIIFLSSASSFYASGSQIMLSDSISQAVQDATYWRKVRYWVTSRSNTAPGIFYKGRLQEFNADAGTIRILESGLYLINVNIAISNGDNDFEIAIHTTEGVSSLITKYGKTARKIYTMKLFGIMFLTSGQVISVRIRSTAPTASWENLRPYSGWSFVRIPPFSVAMALNSGFKDTQTLETTQSLWSRVRYWTSSVAAVQELSGEGFNGNNGYFTAKYNGIYLITCSISFIMTQSGSQIIRQKIGINGDISLPGSKVFDSGNGPTRLISNCQQKCASPLAEIVQLNEGDIVAIYVQSSLDTVDMSFSTSFSIKYLSSLNPLPNGFSMQLQQTITVSVYGDKQITGWLATPDAIPRNGQYYKNTGGKTDEYFISTTGLYLVSANLKFTDISGIAKAMPSLDNIPTLSAVHYSSETESYTISVVGVMLITVGSVYTVTVRTEQDQSYRISDSSTSSLTYVGELSDVPGFTATFNREFISTYTRDTWYPIDSWSTVGKDWLFESKGGFESKASYIVQESGFYLIAANVIFKNTHNSSASAELSLVHNNINDLTNGLYGESLLLEGGKTTLQVHGGIYLNKWDFLELRFRLNATLADLTLDQESTFSIIKLGNDISSIPCIDSGPNIVGKIVPDNIRMNVGLSIEWNCFATGDNPSYQWLKDLNEIPGETGSKLSLTNLNIMDGGDFVCSASSNGIKSYSNIAKLTVYDSLPRFLNDASAFVVLVPENGADSADLLQIMAQAESFDLEHAEMNFEIVGGDSENQFSLSPNTSTTGTTLIRVKTLDRESINSYTLQVAAINSAVLFQKAIQNITIIVEDLNDNAPIFFPQTYNVTVSENTTINSHIITVSATDLDIDGNGIVRYTLIPGSATGVFSVDEVTGAVVLLATIDRESKDYYVLFIVASDGKYNTYTELTILIDDINEHRPYFLKDNYVVEVPETLIPGIPMLRILAADNDAKMNAKITYVIDGGDNSDTFMLTEFGDLQTKKFLDYETNSSYSLEISIHDNGVPQLSAINKAKVEIIVRNSNDNRPRFTQPEYTASINENLQVFTPAFAVKATDPDGGFSIRYSIPAYHNLSNIFHVTVLTGNIELLQPLDYETEKFYQFTVEASDDGLPPKVASANILVKVLDENDNKPVFVSKTNDQIEMVESIETGRIIYQVSAEDADDGANGLVNYKIVQGNTNDMFYVNHITGAVTAIRPLDREITNFYRLKITAFDYGNPSLSSLVAFTLDVTIIDANDNTPEFNEPEYVIDAREDSIVGISIASFTVTDKDDGDNGRFNISILKPSLQDVFQVVYQTDTVYDLKLVQPLNFEVQSSYRFTVVAKDFGDPSLEKAVSVTVRVVDVNDNAPMFQNNFYTTTLNDAAFPNLTVYQVVAIDPDVGPLGRLSYEIIDGNVGNAFTMEEYSGIVTTTARSNLTFFPTYELKIIAKDSYSPPLVSNVTTLFVRVTKTPNIILSNTNVGYYQITTHISLADFSHLDYLVKYEVLVQQYHPNDPLFNLHALDSPVSWHDVFTKDTPNNYLRRYIAIEKPYPNTGSNKIIVTVGTDINCTSAKFISAKICNGPLAAGKTYRLQVRVYERNSLVPIASHFSGPVVLPAVVPSKATFSETIEDGMMALAAAFCIVFVAAIIVILIYICWKLKHELMYVDHLRESRFIEPVDKIASPSNVSPRFGRVVKFSGFDNGGMWPELSMAEQNLLLHRSANKRFVNSPNVTPGIPRIAGLGGIQEFKSQNNMAFEFDEDELEKDIIEKHPTTPSFVQVVNTVMTDDSSDQEIETALGIDSDEDF